MNLSLQLLFHGAVVLLIGSLSGIPYGSAITNKKDEEVIRLVSTLALILGCLQSMNIFSSYFSQLSNNLF